MTNIKTIKTQLESTLKNTDEKIKQLKEDLTANNVIEQDILEAIKNDRIITNKIIVLTSVRYDLKKSMEQDWD